uniref:Uncharacterized protein n=1 Tax=Caenorhabditis japonica TaxID=281687 RepID=A0A8R1I7I4_CAEJA
MPRRRDADKQPPHSAERVYNNVPGNTPCPPASELCILSGKTCSLMHFVTENLKIFIMSSNAPASSSDN